MAKNSQVNIRFDEGTDADLTATAAKLGVSKSALVRHLTKTFLEQVTRTGSLQLEPQWREMLGTADARSEWGERKLVEEEQSLKAAEEPKDYNTRNQS